MISNTFYSVEVGGSAASNGYYVDAQIPGAAVAAGATNVALGFYEAGADGAALDLMNGTDMSSAITVFNYYRYWSASNRNKLGIERI